LGHQKNVAIVIERLFFPGAKEPPTSSDGFFPNLPGFFATAKDLPKCSGGFFATAKDLPKCSDGFFATAKKSPSCRK